MSEWDQAQREKWDNNTSDYSDEEEYSDDEYAPIQMASWGTQTVEKDGTTNVNLTASGWASLIDPNFKVQANGLGSGQLHRKGAHYIPVDEQLIVDRRLGKPVPKGGLGGKKKKGSKPKKSAPPPRSSHLAPPSSSASRTNRGAITSGPWASGNLASTPFWEVPASSATTGTYASKYASPLPPSANRAPVRAPAPAPAPAPVQRQAPIPAAVPPTSTTSTGFLQRPLGSSASKYATPQPAQQAAQVPQYQAPVSSPFQQPAQQSFQQPTQQPFQQPFQQPAQQPAQQPVQQTHTIKLDAPVITFNIELSAGVNAKLQVYENDSPESVVDQFEKDHHLVMSQDAKRVFARKIDSLLQQYRK